MMTSQSSNTPTWSKELEDNNKPKKNGKQYKNK